MLKYSSLSNVIINYLKDNLSDIVIEAGKRDELPSVTPCIWIYIEPSKIEINSIKNFPVIRRAMVTFFAVESAAINKTDAANKSIELIEKVEHLIMSNDFKNYINNHSENINERYTDVTYTDSDTPLSFDAIYSDVAVSYLEVYINYSPFWETI